MPGDVAVSLGKKKKLSVFSHMRISIYLCRSFWLCICENAIARGLNSNRYHNN